MIHEINVRVKLSIIEDSEELKKIFAEQLKVPVQQITEFKILKRSIDARSRNIVFQLKVQVGIQEKIPVTNHFFSEKKTKNPPPLKTKPTPPNTTNHPPQIT